MLTLGKPYVYIISKPIPTLCQSYVNHMPTIYRGHLPDTYANLR